MVLPESKAIPYESGNLRGERLLVLAPHPDDEVIGCGGLLALHLREQRAVRVVVITDGSEAGDRSVREDESRQALSHLGAVEPEFLRFRDRRLDDAVDDLKNRLRDILIDFKPDLIAVPSPIEIHPDHAALSRAFCELIQADPALFATLAVARVAFYEVSYTIRPNTLVDITPVAEVKYAAISLHRSQTAQRDYAGYARGLNAFRAMTLAPETRYAEAYWVTPLPSLRTTAFTSLRAGVGAPPPIEVHDVSVPISVIVRTRNRPALLREAVDSIRATGYPAEIVVVNDGGASPDLRDVTLIEHQTSRGRSEAMNAGVRAARSSHIAFLDDDDLYYPEHLATLAAAARSKEATAWYSDAVSAFLRIGAEGTYETHSRMRIFGSDFDAKQLLVDNYIPLPTLLVPRQTFLAEGGFDPDFDLFEDWDFLIRLGQRGPFVHVPRITCEIRHIEGAGSITLHSPEGSARFREAKLQVWKKHAALLDDGVMADVLEQQKRRLLTLQNEIVESRGLQNHLHIDVSRLERETARQEGEKQALLREIQSLHERINETMMRISHLEGANAEIRNALAYAEADRHEKGVRLRDLQAAYEETERTNAALFAEIGRVQGLLDMIYKSKTWKLHEIVLKLKGEA